MSNKFRQIADWLTLATVFLLPWQTRYIIETGQLKQGPYEYLSISLYGLDLLILGALLCAALAIVFDKKISNKFDLRAYWLIALGLLFFT